MTFTIETTPEQDVAIQRSFDALLEKGKLTLEEWLQAQLDAVPESHVTRWTEADLGVVLNKLQKYSSQLSVADLTEVAAVAEKYANQ